MKNLFLILLVFIFASNVTGLKCFSCVLKSQEDPTVTRKCEDFYKASGLEKQEQFVVECKTHETACIHHKNTGGSKVYLEEYGCHIPTTKDDQQGLVMDKCVNLKDDEVQQGTWKTCLCNMDFCRVDESKAAGVVAYPITFTFCLSILILLQ